MRVTIYLSDRQAEELEALARLEHRTVRQQATVLVIKGLSASLPLAPADCESKAAA